MEGAIVVILLGIVMLYGLLTGFSDGSDQWKNHGKNGG